MPQRGCACGWVGGGTVLRARRGHGVTRAHICIRLVGTHSAAAAFPPPSRSSFTLARERKQVSRASSASRKRVKRAKQKPSPRICTVRKLISC